MAIGRKSGRYLATSGTWGLGLPLIGAFGDPLLASPPEEGLCLLGCIKCGKSVGTTIPDSYRSENRPDAAAPAHVPISPGASNLMNFCTEAWLWDETFLRPRSQPRFGRYRRLMVNVVLTAEGGDFQLHSPVHDRKMRAGQEGMVTFY